MQNLSEQVSQEVLSEVTGNHSVKVQHGVD